MTTLGQAWIEIHADTKPFAEELAPELKAILAAVEKITSKEGVKVGKGLASGVAKGVDQDADRIRRSFGKVGDDLKRQSRSWERSLAAPFQRLAKGNFILTRIFGQMILSLGRATKRVAAFGKGLGGIAVGIGKVALGLGQGVVEGLKAVIGVGGDAARVGSTLAAGFARIGTSIAAMGAEALAAAPAVAALAAIVVLAAAAIAVLVIALATVAAPFATLLNLALAVPAALSFLLAVILPLVIAFHDMGDAMELVFEKDPKKLAEGLKKLSPTMRGLVGILRTFGDEFKILGDSVQKAFFTPILTQLKPALDAILPVLTGGFNQIASALGFMVVDVLKFVSQRTFIEAMALAMNQIAEFLMSNSTMLTDILRALSAMASAALPVVLELIGKFGQFLVEFGAWIMGAITDGRFEIWLQKGITALQNIWNLVKALLALFQAMFAALNADGNEFLQIITKAINKFTNWIKSPEGEKALKNMGTLAKIVASAFAAALDLVQKILSVVNRIVDAWRWIKNNPISWPFNNGPGGPTGGGGPSYAGGGVVPADQMAMVHAGEPILDPANSVEQNKSILADAGMLDVLSEPTVVNVYIGAERLNERIDYRVGMNNRAQTQALANGPRS